MKAQGLARLGRDAELRYLTNGDAVVNLAMAFSYGKKGEDGNRPTQWVDGAFYGKRAEALAPYLVKGGQVVAYLDDIHIETYEGRNGAGHKLVGRISDIELVAGNRDAAGQSQAQGAPRQSAPQQRPVDRPPQQRQTGQAQRQQPAPQRGNAPATGGGFADDGFSDMDQDIPFITSAMACDMATSKSRRMVRCAF